MGKMKSLYETTMMVEGAEGYEAETPLEHYKAIQTMINLGQWSLQGSFGRTMMEAITTGRCLCGHERAKDYWGNTVPARGDLQAGTKGTYEFVKTHMGKEWADTMRGV